MADKNLQANNHDEMVIETEEIEVDCSSEDNNLNKTQATADNANTIVKTDGMTGSHPEWVDYNQARLGSTMAMMNNPTHYLQNLPKPVKQRIKALKKLQFETSKIEADFYRELHQIECNFAQRYTQFFETRREIVNGILEPTDQQCDWANDELLNDDPLPNQVDVMSTVNKNTEADQQQQQQQQEKKTEGKEVSETPTVDGNDIKGIPYFWLTVFKNVDMLAEMTEEHDEPILKHMTDIQCSLKDNDPSVFTLEFYFEANDYFTNSVLTKEYNLKTEPEKEDAFSYEGPEIVRCKGCTIDWKPGKNVTVRTTRKKMKHKGSGKTMVVTKTKEADSFFIFFNPPAQPDDIELDECSEAILTADFEIGHFIRERIIPRAVLYFTGEAVDDGYDKDEEAEEEGEEEYDEDEDQDYDPTDEKDKRECKTQ